jgi:hypothetical protein
MAPRAAREIRQRAMSSHRATSSAKSGGGEPVPTLPASGRSHYQLLEISPQATVAELRQAFRHLSKRYHPDTTTLPPAEAREAFTRLRQAYAVLADPDSRRAYDAALQRPAPPLVVVPPLPSGPAAAARPIGVRRSLSGGEWFALVLLGLALALSLVLGVGLAWARGAALITRPSWWSEAAPVPAAAPLSVSPSRSASPERSTAAPSPSASRSQPSLSQSDLTQSVPAPPAALLAPVSPSASPADPAGIGQAP